MEKSSVANTPINSHYDAIVVGTGMGGLTCASLLARTGKRVLALEQHYVAGGMTHTFKRKDYVWDVGVHALGEMAPGNFPRKVLDFATEGRVEMHKYDEVYDSFQFPDGLKIDFPANRDLFFERLKEQFPHETKGLDQYRELISKAAKSGYGHFFVQLLPSGFARILAPFIARKFKKYSQTTTEAALDKIIKDKRLKAVLTAQWGYYGPPPEESSFYMHAVTVRHFWHGGYYPVGGSQVFAEEMGKTIEKSGGEIKTRSGVKQILEKEGKAIGVELQNGSKYFAPLVISAVGAKATVNNLVNEKWRQSGWSKEILKLEQSPCHVALYLGFDGDITKSGARASNQWFFETYDSHETCWDVEKSDSIAPVLYVSFPSLKDPKHTGTKHTGEVVTFVPYDYFKKWESTLRGKRGDEYNAIKKNLEERLLNQLFKHMPELKKHLTYVEFSTPLSTVFYCHSPRGAIYGISPTPERFRCQSLKPETPFKNFYLTGSDVGTLGVVGAMMGGVLTAAKIEPKLWKQFKK